MSEPESSGAVLSLGEPESSGAVLSLGALDKSVSVDGPGVSIGVNMSC